MEKGNVRAKHIIHTLSWRCTVGTTGMVVILTPSMQTGQTEAAEAGESVCTFVVCDYRRVQ